MLNPKIIKRTCQKCPPCLVAEMQLIPKFTKGQRHCDRKQLLFTKGSGQPVNKVIPYSCCLILTLLFHEPVKVSRHPYVLYSGVLFVSSYTWVMGRYIQGGGEQMLALPQVYLIRNMYMTHSIYLLFMKCIGVIGGHTEN